MPRPRNAPLQNRLEQLVQSLVDAVMDAVRAATLDQLAEKLAPATSQRSPRYPSPAPAARARRPPPMRTKVPQVAPTDLPEPEATGGMTITDPAAVLAFVASLESNAREQAAGGVSVPDAPIESEDERPLVNARTPRLEVEEPPRTSTRLEVKARPGEDVLRSAAGGAVLRRRASR